MQDDNKRLAAEAAVAEIGDDMLIGIGTGTTVAFAIEAIGRRREQWPKTKFFASSRATGRTAAAFGIPIMRFASVARLDLTIDGVDEIDTRFRAIKGGGGALLREKIIATASDRMVAIADGAKRVHSLGKAPIPVEILPFAKRFAQAQLSELGARPVLRMSDRMAVYRTDQGNFVLDCHFAAIPDPSALAVAIQAIPGALGHGMFLTEIDATYIGEDGIVTKMERSLH